MPCYAQGCRWAGVYPAVFYQDYTIAGVTGQIEAVDDIVASFRLKGCKSKDAFGIPVDDKGYAAVAKVAKSVKQQHAAFGKSFIDCSLLLWGCCGFRCDRKWVCRLSEVYTGKIPVTCTVLNFELRLGMKSFGCLEKAVNSFWNELQLKKNKHKC